MTSPHRRSFSLVDRTTAALESRLHQLQPQPQSQALKRQHSATSATTAPMHDSIHAITTGGPSSGDTSGSLRSPTVSSFSGSEDTHQLICSSRYEDYEIGDPIGYGASAVVYGAQYIPSGKKVALKVIELDAFERHQIDELRRETQVMSLSRHPNLLSVAASFVYDSRLYLVTPYIAGGSCLDIIKSSFPQGFEESVIATIGRQTLQGLEYLHKHGHIHRDVKAGNLLVAEDGTVMLADFGVSSSLNETGERRGRRKTFVGTPCWMAPEVMEQAGYDYMADIWSFGITLYELCTGHAPYAQYPAMKVLMMTLNNDPPSLDRDRTYYKYGRALREVIDMCLQKDPTKRPSAERLLSLSFFKQAKKRQHLVQALIRDLPPLEVRQMGKVPPPGREQGAEDAPWNFSPTGTVTPVPVDHPVAPGPTVSFGEVTTAPPSLPTEASIPPITTTTNTLSGRCPTQKGRFLVDDEEEGEGEGEREGEGEGEMDHSKTDVPPRPEEGHLPPLGSWASTYAHASPTMGIDGGVASANMPTHGQGQGGRRERKMSDTSGIGATSSSVGGGVTFSHETSSVTSWRGRFEVVSSSANPSGQGVEEEGDSLQEDGDTSGNILMGERGKVSSIVWAPAGSLAWETPGSAAPITHGSSLTLQEQLDSLIRQNLSQQSLLHHLHASLGGPPVHSPQPTAEDASLTTLATLERHLHSLLRENEALREENALLRQQLMSSATPPPSNTHANATLAESTDSVASIVEGATKRLSSLSLSTMDMSDGHGSS